MVNSLTQRNIDLKLILVIDYIERPGGNVSPFVYTHMPRLRQAYLSLKPNKL